MRIGRADRGHDVAGNYARFHEREAPPELRRVHAKGRPRQAEARHDLAVEHALVRKIVDGEHQPCPAECLAVAIVDTSQQGRQPCLPVVGMQHVDRRRRPIVREEVERRCRQQREAIGVVAEVASPGPVEARSIEQGGNVDEDLATPRRSPDDVERRVVGERAAGDRARHGRSVAGRQPAVARHEGRDRAAERLEGGRQRCGDVGQAAGLRPGHHFRGHHGDMSRQHSTRGAAHAREVRSSGAGRPREPPYGRDAISTGWPPVSSPVVRSTAHSNRLRASAKRMALLVAPRTTTASCEPCGT